MSEQPEDAGSEIETEEEFEFDPTTLESIPEEEVVAPLDMSFGANLANYLEESELQDIGNRRQEVLQSFKNAREKWELGIRQGIKWLGLSAQDESESTSDNACTAVHPILMENVVKFQAKAIQELWPAKGPVRTKVKGYVDVEREKAATRVRNFMNYQLTEQIPGFYADLERNLFRVAFMGTGIRKAGWNAAAIPDGAPDPVIVYAENFYVDPSVSHLRHADEHIEVIPMTGRVMRSHVNGGMFRECDDEEPESVLTPDEIEEAIAQAQGFEISNDRTGFRIGESHCYLDLEGADPLVPDGGVAPYIIHFNVESGKVYAIRRNWAENDPYRNKLEWYTADVFIPAFGFYGLGFVHLIGDIAASSSATLRALVDAGNFANWQAGFKSKDAKFSNSDSPLDFGEFRDVNLGPEELQKAFLPLPSKEPSQVLFQLLQYMVAAGQKFADTTDEVVQGATNYGPAATTMALLEASGRFYSSVHKRLHQSQHDFFKILGRLNRENLPPQVKFVVGSANEFVRNIDFDPLAVDILPASDPNALTESQRIAKAQIELEMAARFPQHHDIMEALRRFYIAMGTDDIDKLLPDKNAAALTADPLSEIQAAMTGRPIKAQMGQDHMAHIAVKEAFLAQPQMQGVNDSMVAAGLNLIKANITEHKTLIFIAQAMQMAQQAGLPPNNEQVQGMIAQQMLAMSAAQGGAGAPSAEQQMIELNKQELEVARERLRSQDARENAKIAMKQQEINLKRAELLADIQDKQANRGMDAAIKILDLSQKEADTAMAPLQQRVANQA
jgi:hypothetical protein